MLDEDTEYFMKNGATSVLHKPLTIASMQTCLANHRNPQPNSNSSSSSSSIPIPHQKEGEVEMIGSPEANEDILDILHQESENLVSLPV